MLEELRGATYNQSIDNVISTGKSLENARASIARISETLQFLGEDAEWTAEIKRVGISGVKKFDGKIAGEVVDTLVKELTKERSRLHDYMRKVVT